MVSYCLVFNLSTLKLVSHYLPVKNCLQLPQYPPNLSLFVDLTISMPIGACLGTATPYFITFVRAIIDFKIIDIICVINHKAINRPKLYFLVINVPLLLI